VLDHVTDVHDNQYSHVQKLKKINC
jgi:hypothetical protein